MRKTLTEKYVAAIKPTGKCVDYWDDVVRGMSLRVTPAGAKSWTALYRNRDDRRVRRYTIGKFPIFSLKSARDEAKRILHLAALGQDPATTKTETRDASSFAELAKNYITRHAMVHKRSWQDDQKKLDHDLLPVWGNRKADSISRKDVIALLNSIMDRGAVVQANRVKALISKIYNFGVSQDLVASNPSYRLAKPGAEHSDDRVLTDTEIATLWRALDDESPDLRDAVKLLLLTGQRKTEVTAMQWAEVDGNTWTIPARRTKNKRPHLVPLCSQALAILHARRDAAGDGAQFVFPNPERASGSIEIAKLMDSLRTRLGFVPHWKTHSLRHTAKTGMSKIGISRFITDRVLNHSDPSVGQRYDHYEYRQEKREALAKWDRQLDRIVNGRIEPEKVVSLRG